MLSVRYIPMQYYDAIIIKVTNGYGCAHNIIVDGGDVNSPKYCYTDRMKKELESIFTRNDSIDLWIITHIDNDHMGGLFNFVKDSSFFDKNRERLKEVWMNYGGKSDYEVKQNGEIGFKSGKALRDVLRQKGVHVRENIKAGLSSSIADVNIKVIAPSENAYVRYVNWWNENEFADVVTTTDGYISGNDWDYDTKFEDFDINHYEEDSEVKNNSSIAFVLTYKTYNILFTGDSCSSLLLDGVKRANMISGNKLRLDLMHIPHHGSNRNSSLGLFQSVDCSKYVITGNGENRYRLPNKETIARLLAANNNGIEIHFPKLTGKLKDIFLEDDLKLNVCEGAEFFFE